MHDTWAPSDPLLLIHKPFPVNRSWTVSWRYPCSQGPVSWELGIDTMNAASVPLYIHIRAPASQATCLWWRSPSPSLVCMSEDDPQWTYIKSLVVDLHLRDTIHTGKIPIRISDSLDIILNHLRQLPESRMQQFMALCDADAVSALLRTSRDSLIHLVIGLNIKNPENVRSFAQMTHLRSLFLDIWAIERVISFVEYPPLLFQISSTSDGDATLRFTLELSLYWLAIGSLRPVEFTCSANAPSS
jgi:hypothetical protein